MRAYVVSIYSGATPTLVNAGAGTFTDAPVDLAEAMADAHGNVGGTLGKIAGAADPGVGDFDGGFRGDLGDDAGWGGDEEENEEDEALGLAEPGENRRWDVIAETWTCPETGLRLELAGDERTLITMGEEFRNGLAFDYFRSQVVTECSCGRAQVLRVMDGDRMVANAYVRNRGDAASFEFVYGPGGTPAEAAANLSPNASTAAQNWLRALNAGDLTMRGSLSETGFSFDEPNLNRATGM